MEAFLLQLKPGISAYLDKFLADLQTDLHPISSRALELTKRLGPYTSRGKMIRGCLVTVGLHAFDPKPTKAKTDAALALGAVMELLQSMLLIHDDIMDQDELRRGAPAVHASYVVEGKAFKISDAVRYGESLGICLGDVAGFAAFRIIADLPVPEQVLSKLLLLTSRELAAVGLAQMDDVANGFSDSEVSEADIYSLYRFKTGRYTFSLPLMLGAVLAGAPEADIQKLGKLGELFGILFQVKDDELGLFGNSAQTGKPRGSDILGGKKTLFRLELLKVTKGSDHDRLNQLFGNKDCSQTDVDFVLERLETLGTRAKVLSGLETWRKQAQDLIGELESIQTRGREALSSVLKYNMTRSW